MFMQNICQKRTYLMLSDEMEENTEKLVMAGRASVLPLTPIPLIYTDLDNHQL